ncbi:MAG: hypothetical protein HY906_05760 [Deltaproteobacteria bacterium]|nr:hypothetical protein [Deltaproteobacteria bacterium]
MRFESRARYHGTLDEVQSSLLDDRYVDFLLKHHGVLLEAQVLEKKDSGDKVSRKVRYRPKPVIESVGPKKVPPEYFAFVEDSTFDKTRHEMTFTNRATTRTIANMLVNTGTLKLRAVGNECERVMEGEISLKLPFLLKPLAIIGETVIHREGLKILDGEVPVMNRFLTEVLRAK